MKKPLLSLEIPIQQQTLWLLINFIVSRRIDHFKTTYVSLVGSGLKILRHCRLFVRTNKKLLGWFRPSASLKGLDIEVGFSLSLSCVFYVFVKCSDFVQDFYCLWFQFLFVSVFCLICVYYQDGDRMKDFLLATDQYLLYKLNCLECQLKCWLILDYILVT